MVPSKLKKEPTSTPPPRKCTGNFMDDSNAPVSEASSVPKREYLIPEANWRECKDDKFFQGVRIKEFAAKDALISMRKMLTTLGSQVDANPSCQPRIDKIKEILSRKRDFKITVGFLGATGAGKTTLLNALIGCSNLLPSSAWRASTAVPVEVSYNSDGGSLFQAKVSYITAEEWAQELQSLFEDIQAASAVDGDDDEDDAERKDRIDKSFDKIKYVYPHIRSLAKLGAISVEELLNHPNVRDVLGSTKTIEKPQKNQLSVAIRQYIDSGDHDEKTPAHWPLIKLVRVFVKSDLLEPGIVLVDLPGNLDSNAARSAVAAKYHMELSVSCIVADVTRGISEKNAHELLGKFTKRNLQLDGMYDANSLCFVLSQTDRHFDIAQYMKQYPDLGPAVAADSRTLWTRRGDICERERERSTIEKSHNMNKKKLGAVSKEIKQLKSRLDGLSSNSAPLLLTKKRTAESTEAASGACSATEEQASLRSRFVQLDKEHSNLRSIIQKEANSLLSYGRRIKSLKRAQFFANSRLQAQCINHRNNLSIAAVRSDFEATLKEMGRQPSEQLQVFPVSATVYLHYLSTNNGNKGYMGFPNREDTQIPALRDWLTGTTLDGRDKCAQAFLGEVDIFLNSMKPWIENSLGDTKMSAEMREYLQPQVDRMVIELEENLRGLSINTTNSMKQLVTTNIYSKVSEARKLAGAKAKRTAEKWTVGTHWSTYRVVNRERGIWKDSKGKIHKWNHELVHDLTSYVLKAWDQTFFRQFPEEKNIYIDHAMTLIRNFAAASTHRDLCPDATDGLNVLEDHILKTFILLRNQTDAAFDEMKKIIKKSHKQAVPAVREFLEGMYEKCASESGRGHYARNKQTVKKTMTDDGVKLHKVGAEAIKFELDKLLDDIPVQLAVGYDLALGQIRNEIKTFFEQHSSDGSRNSTRKAVSIAKVQLQQALRPDINELAKKWVSTPPAQQVPALFDPDVTEDENPLNDDLFIDLDKDDDDDYEYNSDVEAD